MATSLRRLLRNSCLGTNAVIVAGEAKGNFTWLAKEMRDLAERVCLETGEQALRPPACPELELMITPTAVQNYASKLIDWLNALDKREAESAKNAKPKEYLFGWREILEAVGRPNTEEDRRRIQRLSDMHAGPIKPRKGQKPMVERRTLLRWWDSLEDRFHQVEQRDLDKRQTVQAQHPHGRNGTVMPEIGGGVKKRRRPS